MDHLIAPSLLAADFTKLGEVVSMINASEADWLHIDIMDGVFVPNISYGFSVLEAIAPICSKSLDVHLMIVEPEKYIERFREVGAEIITVHLEACPHLHSTIQQIHRSGAKAGVAINPHTPVSMLTNVLDELDLVLIMSVNPGFGGQKFIYQSLSKIRELRAELESRNLSPYIEVDGGIGEHNLEAILRAGANVVVAGSSIFGNRDPLAVIHRMKQLDIHNILI